MASRRGNYGDQEVQTVSYKINHGYVKQMVTIIFSVVLQS